LERVLGSLREIPHVEIVRLAQMPCVLPQRITAKAVQNVEEVSSAYINTHFNHPWNAHRKLNAHAILRAPMSESLSAINLCF